MKNTLLLLAAVLTIALAATGCSSSASVRTPNHSVGVGASVR